MPRTSTMGLWALMATLIALPTHARMLDLKKPEDIIRAEIRLGCSPNPDKPRISWMSGKVTARRAGEQDKHIFNVQAMNTRACQTFEDAARGPGYRSVTREIMIYLDPVTNEPLETWRNPWTGETVDVVTMFNDPVNMAEPKYAIGKDGQPATWSGEIRNGFAVTTRAASFFRDGPMSGDYQDYVGGKYNVMEVSTMTIPVDRWLDTSKPQPIPMVSAWTRISPWIPWMKMGGREGQTILSSVWYAGATLDDVPEPLRTHVRTKYPDYAKAPPLDDTRKSINSWDAMKKAFDEKRKK